VTVVQTQKLKCKNLLAVTNRGEVQVMDVPNPSTNGPHIISSLMAHQGECTHVLATVDSKYLVTAGNDGIIFVYKISEYIPSAKRQPVDDGLGL
jgi:WD40 repeat protein